MDKVAPARRHAPEAMLVKAMRGGRLSFTRKLTRLPGQPCISGRAGAAPCPMACLRCRKTQLPGAAPIPKGRAAPCATTFMGEVRPYFLIDVGIGIILLRG